MQAKGVIAYMFILPGLIGYLLFDSMGIWGGVLTAGLFSMGLFLKQFVGFRNTKGNLGGKRIRIYHGRQRRARQISEKKARLEALRTRAHLLAGACQDTYGAQRCCLEIISQTEKEDPLFMEACDLYMRTVTIRTRLVRDSRRLIPSNPCQSGARLLPAAANIIPFPLMAGSN